MIRAFPGIPAGRITINPWMIENFQLHFYINRKENPDVYFPKLPACCHHHPAHHIVVELFLGCSMGSVILIACFAETRCGPAGPGLHSGRINGGRPHCVASAGSTSDPGLDQPLFNVWSAGALAEWRRVSGRTANGGPRPAGTQLVDSLWR